MSKSIYVQKPPKTAPRAARRCAAASRLRQLELLAALERAPTLSAAAREARLSQPAASKLLGALSDDLAIDLFEKAGRSLRPTAAGQRADPPRRQPRSAISTARRPRSRRSKADCPARSRSVPASAPATCWCRARCALLLDQAPDVAVTMREGAMEEHFAMLRDGRLDLVVGRVEPALVDRDFAAGRTLRSGGPYRGGSAASAGARDVGQLGRASPSRTGSCRRRARRCAPASSASSGA